MEMWIEQGVELEESVDGRVVFCSLLFLSQVHRDFMGDLLPRRCLRAVGIQQARAGAGLSIPTIMPQLR